MKILDKSCYNWEIIELNCGFFIAMFDYQRVLLVITTYPSDAPRFAGSPSVLVARQLAANGTVQLQLSGCAWAVGRGWSVYLGKGA